MHEVWAKESYWKQNKKILKIRKVQSDFKTEIQWDGQKPWFIWLPFTVRLQYDSTECVDVELHTELAK